MNEDKPDEKAKPGEIRLPLDSTSKDGVIDKTGNQDRWKVMEQAHYLDQDESATGMLFKTSGPKFGIDGAESHDHMVAQRLPDFKPVIDSAKAKVSEFMRPHATELDKWVDKNAAQEISEQLPRLKAFSERNHGAAPKLIEAIMKNEQTYYDRIIDGIQDGIVQSVGSFPGDATIGPGQIKESTIQRLVTAHPAIFGKPKDVNKEARCDFCHQANRCVFRRETRKVRELGQIPARPNVAQQGRETTLRLCITIMERRQRN